MKSRRARQAEYKAWKIAYGTHLGHRHDNGRWRTIQDWPSDDEVDQAIRSVPAHFTDLKWVFNCPCCTGLTNVPCGCPYVPSPLQAVCKSVYTCQIFPSYPPPCIPTTSPSVGCTVWWANGDPLTNHNDFVHTFVGNAVPLTYISNGVSPFPANSAFPSGGPAIAVGWYGGLQYYTGNYGADYGTGPNGLWFEVLTLQCQNQCSGTGTIITVGSSTELQIDGCTVDSNMVGNVVWGFGNYGVDNTKAYEGFIILGIDVPNNALITTGSPSPTQFTGGFKIQNYLFQIWSPGGSEVVGSPTKFDCGLTGTEGISAFEIDYNLCQLGLACDDTNIFSDWKITA